MTLTDDVLALLPTELCVEWPGRINDAGYGHVTYKRRSYKAHRLIYLLTGGEIAEGLHLDHLCRNTRCVNPLHLEPVTPRTNSLRSESFAAQNARKTNCPQGHAYDDENTYIYGTGRLCRTCLAANNVRQTARRRALRVSS